MPIKSRYVTNIKMQSLTSMYPSPNFELNGSATVLTSIAFRKSYVMPSSVNNDRAHLLMVRISFKFSLLTTKNILIETGKIK